MEQITFTLAVTQRQRRQLGQGHNREQAQETEQQRFRRQCAHHPHQPAYLEPIEKRGSTT